MIATEPQAPNSAPNTEPAAVAGAREKEWKKEIHTPEAEYNANVPIDLIERDPANRVPADDAVAALAKAIEAEGLLQPIVLRAMEGGKYRIIAGEHRWSAFQLLKRPTISARIYKSEDDLSAARKALVENNAREGLTPVERARRFKQLEELGMKQREIGALAGGVSQPVVANAMRLLALPVAVQEMVNDGKLSEAHGVNLAKFAKWPRACACMARMAYDHGYNAKYLAEEGLPFANQLEQEGLMVRIRTKERYLSDERVYKLPRHLYSHRDFIVGDWCVYYVLPDNPKDNVWGPEQAKQDAEFDARDLAAAKRASIAAAKGDGKTKEQLERATTLANNKARRAENVKGLELAIDKLKRTPVPTALLIGILAKEATGGAYGARRIQEAAASLGIKLPNGVVTEGSYGMNGVEIMRKMDVMDVARLALAVILIRETELANRAAFELPKYVEFVMNADVPPANLGIGDVVEWDSCDGLTGQPKVKRGAIVSDAEYAKESGSKQGVGKTYMPVKLANPNGFDLPYNGIALAGLRVVKSAAPAELVKLPPCPAVHKKAAKAAKKGGK